MPFSSEKLALTTDLKAQNEKELKGQIPAVRRSKFTARIKTIEAEAAKMAKEKAKVDEKIIISNITKFFEGEGETKPGMVALLDVTPDPKLLTNSIATAMRKWKQKKSVYLLAADSNKVVHVCYVPQVLLFTTGLTC